MPLDGFDLEQLTAVEQRQVAVLLLWAISRARMGHDTTTRFLSEQSELADYLSPFADLPDAASAWGTVRASDWWTSDVSANFPLRPSEVTRLNPAGGLALNLLDTARDDERCTEPVRSLAGLLPAGEARDDLLYGFALEHLVEREPEESSNRAGWPGILDADLARGSHELADAAAVGDWEAVLELLEPTKGKPGSLINTWRPGGVSMVTPLHQAAIKGAPVDVVEKLIEVGAWRSLCDSRGWLPVDLALLHGRSELVALLAPPAVDQRQSALVRALTYRLGKLLVEVMKEDAVPRFRAPQVAVITEVGGEIEFDLTGSGHRFNVFLEEGELLVEHISAGSDEGGVVYRLDGTGVIDTWENDSDEDRVPQVDPNVDTSANAPGVPGSDDVKPESRTSAGEKADAPEVATEPETPRPETPVSVEPTQTLSRPQTLWSEMSDCAITVVPHEAVRRFNRERKRTQDVVVVTVSEFKKGRRWESVVAVPPTEEISDQSVAGKRWSYALVIEFATGRDQLKANMRFVLEREAESGLGPQAHKDLLVAMQRRSGGELARQVGELWAQIHALAVSAHVEPQRANLPKPTLGSSLQTGVADARERRGASANPDASTGGEERFSPPVRLSLESSNFSARADWDGESIIVKSGSAARRATLESMPAESRAIRRDLLQRGILREVSGRYVFTRDCRFRSVSSAACLIAGRTAGGRVEWKDPQGRTINDLLGGPKFRKRN